MLTLNNINVRSGINLYDEESYQKLIHNFNEKQARSGKGPPRGKTKKKKKER